MNKYDEKYIIRLANYDEIPDIMIFIDRYWKKGHILSVNRDFFEYEMVIDGQVNFLLAKNRSNDEIEGILGFLPCSRSRKKLDIWGVIWKTIDGAVPMLGMELKKRLMKIIGARTDLGVGANPDTSIPLLSRIYHYYTAEMSHFYCLSNRENYKIAKVKNRVEHTYNYNQTTHFQPLLTAEEMKAFFDFKSVCDVIPYKDAWYYERRFFNHPIYKYDIWGLSDDQDDKAMLVLRIEKYNESSAARIVDYIGRQKLFSGCGSFLDALLKENEYVDFYFDGFEKQYAIDAGMKELTDNDENIIPDYFNPYELQNIKIYVDSSDKKNKCTFYKADGDQDRPN